MNNDDLNDRFETHEEILRSFAATIAHQRTINERLTAAIERLDATQARIETLLAHLLHPGQNGH